MCTPVHERAYKRVDIFYFSPADSTHTATKTCGYFFIFLLLTQPTPQQMHIRMFPHMSIRMSTRMSVHMSIGMSLGMSVYRYACRQHVHTRVYMHVHTHVNTHVCTAAM